MPRLLLLLAVAAPVAGCSDRPKAPPLTNESVYQNDKVGLRFRVPEGWPVESRADPPPGPLARPVVLASYRRKGGEKPADFAVLVADVPADADPGRFLADTRLGAEAWVMQGKGEAVTVNGVPATRFVQTHAKGKDDVRREATAFRRGDRVYYFIVSFYASDTAGRDAARASVESVTWTK